MNLPLTRRLAAVGLAALAVLTSACAIGPGSSSGNQIRIAYQTFPSGDLVVKNQHWLEDAFPGRTVRWIKFDSGADINTAFLSGQVDFGAIGSAPAARGLSYPLNIDYRVAFVLDVAGDNEALVARKDTGISTVAGLRGKRVATAFASTAHYSLLTAMAAAGLKPGDVKLIDLQPQATLAAWQRGDIDAAYTWLPTLDELRKDGTVVLTSRELAQRGKPTLDLGMVSGAFARENPAIVDKWRQIQARALDLIATNPNRAASAVAAELGVDRDAALGQLRQAVFLTRAQLVSSQWLGTQGAPGGVAENLRSAADFLTGQHQLQHTPTIADFRAAIYTEGLPNVVTAH